MLNQSRIPAANLPKITELRKELDYGDVTLPRCGAFYDDVRVFRKKFQTEKGLPGTSLFEWKSPEHQDGLAEMTLAYLERDGNGPLFWPEDPSSLNFNKLQYSKHSNRIKQAMKQLFFRLNEQQYRNNKYRNKERPPRPSPSPLDTRGSTTEEPIDVDAPPHTRQDSAPPSRDAHRPMQTRDALPGGSTREIPPEHARERASDRHSPDDPWSIPESPAPEDMPGENQPPRRTTPKKPREDASPTSGGQGREAKRLKTNHKPYIHTPKKPLNSPAVGRHLSDPQPVRNSPRKKETYKKDGFLINNAYTAEMHEQLDVESTTGEPAPSLDGHDEDIAQPVSSRTSPKAPPKDPPSPSLSRRTLTARPATPPQPPQSPKFRQPDIQIPRPETDFRQSGLTQSAVLDRGGPDPERLRQDPHPRGNELEKPFDRSEMSRMEPVKDPLKVNRSALGEAEAARLPANASNFRESSHGSDKKSPQVPPPRNQSSIELIYRRTISRYPVYSSQRWEPPRKLSTYSLSEFIRDAAFEGDVRGIYFSVDGPGLETEEKFDLSDDAEFRTFVRTIQKVMRMQLGRKDSAQSSLVYAMEIEPIRDDDARAHEECDEADFTI